MLISEMLHKVAKGFERKSDSGVRLVNAFSKDQSVPHENERRYGNLDFSRENMLLGLG